jgi:hypothetical protein
MNATQDLSHTHSVLVQQVPCHAPDDSCDCPQCSFRSVRGISRFHRTLAKSAATLRSIRTFLSADLQNANPEKPDWLQVELDVVWAWPAELPEKTAGVPGSGTQALKNT